MACPTTAASAGGAASAYFSHEERGADSLRSAEQRQHIRRLEKLGLDTACRSRSSRRDALYGIATSIVIAIVYWALPGRLRRPLQQRGPAPHLAAWAPNLLFGGAALCLMFTLET